MYVCMYVWSYLSIKNIITSQKTDRYSKIPTTKSKGKKWEKFTMLKQGQKLPNGGNMQDFLRTPWNAKSRTTAQDALWQHMLDRNTSSQPFMTPCAHQVMNRIPGNVTPPWAGCWGPLHSCSMSRAIYLPAQRNRQPARPTPQTEAPPPYPGKTTPCPVWHLPAIWNHLHIEDSCGFQWRDVDAVTPEFSQNLHNTSPEYFRHPLRGSCEP